MCSLFPPSGGHGVLAAEAEGREDPTREVQYLFVQCWLLVPATFVRSSRDLRSAQKVFTLLHHLLCDERGWIHHFLLHRGNFS